MSTFSANSRRIRFWFRLIQAYIRRYQLRILLVLFTLFAISIFIGNLWKSISRNDLVSIGYVGNYSIENIPSEILELATTSLVTSDDAGRPIPSLASHWTVSDDGKTYIVFLKDNQSWHDESLVDTSNLSIALTDVQITSLNNKALEFKLVNPISSFLQVLDKPIFKTKSFYGTGEYKIVKIDEIKGIVKRIVLRPKNPNFPDVEIKFYQTQLQAVQAFKIGDVKMAKIANISEFESWVNIDVEKSVDYSQIVTIFFNLEDPILASKDLRQALTYSINKTNFDGEIATGPISPKSWSFNDSLQSYNFNVGKSKELLAKLPNTDFEITLHFSPGLKNLAESIESDWESIGIKTKIAEFTAPGEQFHALLAINQINPDPDQYSLWHSTQSDTNITSYKNVKVDKLLEDARGTLDESIRLENYLEFQQEIIEDLPAAFLYHPNKYSVSYKNIRSLIERLPAEI